MADKTLEELDMENYELLWAVKYFRKAYKSLKEENEMLRKLLLDKGVKNE